jgi:hypothetical protein
LYEERAGRSTAAATNGIRSALQIAVMFGFTLYGWLLFRATSGAQIAEMTLALGNLQSPAFLAKELAKLVFFAWPVLLLDYLKYRGGHEQPILLRAPMAVQAFAYAGILIMFIILGRYEGASFIYFQF